jgi:hypothetical protein
MNLKKIALLFILFGQFVFSQQFKTTKFIYEGKIDSVTVSNFYMHNKETSIVGDTIPDGTLVLIKKRKLTNKEFLKLDTYLKSKSSYSKKVPLLNDYNISFAFFVGNKVIQNISVSTLTKKIVIKREDCVSEISNEKEISNQCLFYGSITKDFEKLILMLATK